ncbi:MAG: hypothetical protein H7835_14190, partial [Magnetococcus sp. XQGC-1]
MKASQVEKGVACLRDTSDVPVPLTGVSVSGTLRDLVEEVTIEQRFQNRESRNIEAVYTFPLPVDSVLLDLVVVLGERVLRGAVVEK